jgi:hypothetical protein
MQVFFGIVLAAFGASQAQMAFPDLTKAKGAVTRVFTAIDRKPPIDAQSEEGACLGHMSSLRMKPCLCHSCSHLQQLL